MDTVFYYSDGMSCYSTDDVYSQCDCITCRNYKKTPDKSIAVLCLLSLSCPSLRKLEYYNTHSDHGNHGNYGDNGSNYVVSTKQVAKLSKRSHTYLCYHLKRHYPKDTIMFTVDDCNKTVRLIPLDVAIRMILQCSQNGKLTHANYNKKWKL